MLSDLELVARLIGTALLGSFIGVEREVSEVQALHTALSPP